ncbi:MAG: AsmA family protein [Elusimicrobia bacterium]|nr:AsmA family protein [Elusimicrobiota bacterium]
MGRFRFWLKAAAAAAALGVLGALAAGLLLHAYFPEPKLRAMAVDAARRKLGRDIRLTGADLGLSGLTLRGLEVSEKPDFAAGTFVRVDSFRLRPSWKALLHRRLVVASVSADGLMVRVIKGNDGRFNYESLLSSAAAPAPAAAPGAPTETALDVKSVLVTRGAVDYADRASGAAWSVTDLDLNLRDFQALSAFSADASARVRGKAGARPVDAAVKFSGRVDLADGARAAFRTTVTRLVVQAEGLTLSASGKVAGLDAPKVDFDATLSAAGQELLSAQGTAALGAAVDADVKARTPGLNTALLAALAPKAGIPAFKLPPTELSASIRYAPGLIQLSALRASWPTGKISGSGTVHGADGPSPRFEGKAAVGVDVPEIHPGEYPFLRLPPKLHLPAARVDGELALSGDTLTIAALKATLAAGTVAVTGVVHGLGSAKPEADAAATLALDLPAFTAADLPFSIASLPPSFTVPASHVDGTARLNGDDVRLDGLRIKMKAAAVQLDGLVAKALAGAPQPDVAVKADVSLPPLTDRDLPFAGVPAGLRTPATHWSLDGSYSAREVKIRSLRLIAGHNDVDVSGTVAQPAGRGALDLLIKCRSFSLDELVDLTPRTRDLKPGGTGFFALSVTGDKAHPVYAGKLRFQGLGATVAELPFSGFAGTVSFDQTRVDVPNLVGLVGDGALKMDLTVKDYARAPEIQLEASLDRFDLGRWLAAKSKVQADRRAASEKASPGAAAKPLVISTLGHFRVGKLLHPNATVENVTVGWDLRGLTPDLGGLDGEASLQVGGGRVRSVGDMATESKLVKVLIFPLLIVQKLGRIGGLHLFPNFNDITLHQIVGEYGFKNGVMTLRRSEMDSDAAQVSARGTIDLPKELLDLVVTAQVGRVAPIDVAVTGTVADPKTKVELRQFIIDQLKPR